MDSNTEQLFSEEWNLVTYGDAREEESSAEQSGQQSTSVGWSCFYIVEFNPF